jgi:conjugative relaxase-like TrwC/TraI family protein
MIVVAKVGGAAEAAKYYSDGQEKNYYIDGAQSSEWWGAGAERLGLSGQVDLDRFRAALDGRPEMFGRQVGLSPDAAAEARQEYVRAYNAWEAGRRPGDPPPEPRERLGGIDLTFNAPKDVSLLAANEFGGDARVIEAHQRAVTSTLEKVQSDVESRVNKLNTTTGNVIIARFNEDTTRPTIRENGQGIPDPHMHTHAVLINATQGPDGKWRTLDTKPFFENWNGDYRRSLTDHYRDQLAYELVRLGYQIERDRDGGISVVGIDREDIRAASQRSQDAQAHMTAQGKDWESASAEEKRVAVLETRVTKSAAADRETVSDYWRHQAEQGRTNWREVVGQARERAGADHSSARDTIRDDAGRPQGTAGSSAAWRDQVEAQAPNVARAAVAAAVEHLSERDAAFSARALEREAGRYAAGRVDAPGIRAAIEEARESGALIGRTVKDFNSTGRRVAMDGYTTPQAMETEKKILDAEQRGRGAVGAPMAQDRAQAAVAQAVARAEAKGHEWTEGQRNATIGLLTSSDRFTGVQGFAGTAKTNATLATYAAAMKEQGYQVRALAPTASAAGTLGQAIGAQGSTIHRFLGDRDRAREQSGPRRDHDPGSFVTDDGKYLTKGLDGRFRSDPVNGLVRDVHTLAKAAAAATSKGEVWVVDETSMVGNRTMHELMSAAEQQNARVVFVGDTAQLGSVEAGRAFAQLQDAGMKTHHMEEIVRQTNPDLKEAVYHAIGRDGAASLQALDKGGGQVTEIQGQGQSRAEITDQLRGRMVQDYMALSQEQRSRTIMVEPSREGRAAVNDQVRRAMRSERTLTGKEFRTTTLERKDESRQDQRTLSAYRKGDVVLFEQSSKGQGVKAGEYWRVEGRDGQAVQLRGDDGRQLRYDPTQGLRLRLFTEQAQGIAKGDRILFTKNDARLGVRNTEMGTVQKISRAGVATIESERGKAFQIDLNSRSGQHWTHGYAVTAHAAQGRTSDRVMGVLQGWRQNLVNAKSYYVIISRAKEHAHIYTDSRKGLMSAITERHGEKQAAQDRTAPEGRRYQVSHHLARIHQARQQQGAAKTAAQGKAHARVSRQVMQRVRGRQTPAQAPQAIRAAHQPGQAKPRAAVMFQRAKAARQQPRRIQTVAIRVQGDAARPSRTQSQGRSVFGRMAQNFARELEQGMRGGRDVEQDVHRAVDRATRALERLGDRALAAMARGLDRGFARLQGAAGKALERGFTRIVQSRTLDRIGGQVDRAAGRAINQAKGRMGGQERNSPPTKSGRERSDGRSADKRMQAAEHKADNLLSQASKAAGMEKGASMSRDSGMSR